MNSQDDEDAETAESPDDGPVWVETCEDCEANGYNCPMHDGPEWDDE